MEGRPLLSVTAAWDLRRRMAANAEEEKGEKGLNLSLIHI